MNVEIFDCFGETFDCSICQETIQEGERTYAVQQCQHGFHERCLQPWLQQNGTCPNCRTPIHIGIVGPARSRLDTPDENPSEERLQQHRSELDRMYFSYLLIDWILRNYRGHAQDLRRDYRRLQEAFHSNEWTHGPRPFPLDRLTLSNLEVVKRYIIRRERELKDTMEPQQTHPPIHRSPRFLALRSEALPRLVQFVQRQT